MGLEPGKGPQPADAAGFFRVGDPAPDFTLTSVDGKRIRLSDFRGKVVVLGLFHICEPCRMQGTNLQRIHEATRGKDVVVIGVNAAGDSREAVLRFLRTFPVKVTYPYLLDPRKITDRLYGGGRFIPNVYILDRDGIIRWMRVGGMTPAGVQTLLRVVEELLQEPVHTGT